MKRILMIGTGGTIASGKTAEGLMPELTSEQLLSFVRRYRRFAGRNAYSFCRWTARILPRRTGC